MGPSSLLVGQIKLALCAGSSAAVLHVAASHACFELVTKSYKQPANGTHLNIFRGSKVPETLLVACAVGGNLQDVMREEELAAAAARAAQPAVTDVKTSAPGASRASGWARVAAGSTAIKGTLAPCLSL